MRDLKVRALGPEHIAQAYPLIQTALPMVPLDAWVAFARALVRRRAQQESGLLGVISEQGYLTGLSSYRIVRDLVHGRSLAADHFVAVDLFDRGTVMNTLADAIESLAAERRCAAVHTTVQTGRIQAGSQSTVTALANRGHAVEAVCLCKVLPPGTAGT